MEQLREGRTVGALYGMRAVVTIVSVDEELGELGVDLGGPGPFAIDGEVLLSIDAVGSVQGWLPRSLHLEPRGSLTAFDDA